MSQPLVSIITPTRNRSGLLRLCSRWISHQTYKGPIEWIVIEASELYYPIYPPERDFNRVEIVRVPSNTSIGTMRNIAVMQARGNIIVHFDDDDWQSPNRVARQVDALRGSYIVESSDYYCYFLYTDKASKSWSWGRTFHGSGCSLAYTKDAWRERQFPNVKVGEDQIFCRSPRRGYVKNTRDSDLFVYMRHNSNTSELGPTYVHDTHEALETVRTLVGDEDLARYRALTAAPKSA